MAVKDRVIRPLQKSVVNPLVRLAFRFGVPPPGDALLETTGRNTGRPRQTPVCDGLDGDTFWIVAEHGRDADFVQNIVADPRVRVMVRRGSNSGWRSGTAQILDDDDPRERIRILGRDDFWRRLCVQASGAVGTSLLTVRVDLDSGAPRRRTKAQSASRR